MPYDILRNCVAACQIDALAVAAGKTTGKVVSDNMIV